MKNLIITTTMLLAASSLLAADKDKVAKAAEKLAASDNYSWTTTVETSSQFKPGPSNGKIQKDGLAWMELTMRDNTMEAVAKGDKGAIKTEDGWVSLEDASKDDGGGNNPARFMAMRLRNFKAPAVEAGELAGKTVKLSKSEGGYEGDLTEEGAKSLMTRGPGRRGGAGGAGGTPPEISNAKGSAKFWIKGGVITKYQYKVSGTVNRNGEDVTIDRTTTVEIKDVGKTTLTIPDEAKNKLS